MKNLALAIVLFFSTQVLAQKNIVLPKEYKLETNADYAQYEQKVIEYVDWLLETPVDMHLEKRKEVNAFLMLWMTGSPNVSIALNLNVATFTDNGNALMMFMSGWTKYALTSRDYKNVVEGNIHGIKAVLALYKKNKKQMGKNAAIEEYIKIESKGLLKKHITEVLKSE